MAQWMPLLLLLMMMMSTTMSQQQQQQQQQQGDLQDALKQILDNTTAGTPWAMQLGFVSEFHGIDFGLCSGLKVASDNSTNSSPSAFPPPPAFPPPSAFPPPNCSLSCL
jgi:hypothetical protein